MKKRKHALLFAAVLVALTACGSAKGNSPSDTSHSSPSSTDTTTESSQQTVATAEQMKEGALVKEEALKYVDVPYLYGGKTPEGFDSSGLVQYVYKQALNIDVGSTTREQAAHTTAVPFEDAIPGDLLFWSGNTHVGIYIGNNEFVHAPCVGEKVKVETLANMPLDSKVVERVVK